jgi:hypothetical protein
MNAVVAADVSNSDSVASADEDAATAANNEDAPQIRLLPHLLALSNVALSLQLNSESNRCMNLRLKV